jgi:uncharacterized protein YbjT (DUF2867 family)
MNIFIAGGTGYIGRHLIPELLRRGHTVRALVRNTSVGKLPQGAQPVIGDPLDAGTFAAQLAPSGTFIQLVGVPHPSPAKAEQFRTIDLVAVSESVKAIKGSTIRHFIYLSVAQPSPVMKAYVAVRQEGERLIRETGMPATFVRPFYVLGPGHRWPYLFLPLFWLFGRKHLYPVKLQAVVRAIAEAVEAPPSGVRLIEAPELLAAASPARRDAPIAPALPRS